MKAREIRIRDVVIGGGRRFALIAGPCVIESERVVMETAESLKGMTEELGIPLIFKASYAKDNRSSLEHYYGPGVEEGMRILARVREELDLPVLSDVHYPDEVPIAAEVLDVIQIPAFLSMQTRLALAVGRTGKPVNVKKGQFLAPEDMMKVVRKIEATGNRNILLTERGTVFGYHNLVVDFRSLPIMRETGYPVVFDAGHPVRRYGVPSKDPRGGEPAYIPLLARAGVAAGVDALFLEVHPNPPEALSDAYSMWPLGELRPLLEQLVEIDEIVKAAWKKGAYP